MDAPETPMPESPSEADAGGPRRPRRWLRRLAWGLGGLAGLVGLLGVGSWAFVNSERGASWLIGRGLSAYDGGVEGKVSYSKSEGSFEEGITLSDFEL